MGIAGSSHGVGFAVNLFVFDGAIGYCSILQVGLGGGWRLGVGDRSGEGVGGFAEDQVNRIG